MFPGLEKGEFATFISIFVPFYLTQQTLSNFIPMTKKILCLLGLLMIATSAFPVTFTFRFGTTPISGTVYIYKDGTLIEKASASSSTGTVSVSLPLGTYSYRTESNFLGTCTANETVTLEHRKLTVYVKDQRGNPATEQVRIYEDGVQVDNKTTSSSTGSAEFYLKPSEKYAYKTSFSQGAIPLTSNQELSFIKSVIDVVAKYGDYPVEDNFYVYSYANKGNSFSYLYYKSTSQTNGQMEFALSPGKYWIKNKLDIFTELHVTETNQAFVLDYKKVRFICQSTQPNILEEIGVYNGTAKDTKTTDGKGYADFYLLPGTYTYEHISGRESFTVTRDMEIDVRTRTVNFVLKNKATSTPYSHHSFQIGTSMNALKSFETDANGSCTIQLKAGDYVFSDGLSIYPFTVSNGSLTVTPPLYDLTFEKNSIPQADVPSLILTSTLTSQTKSLGADKDWKVTLLEGDYTLYCSGTYFPNSRVSLTVNQNKTFFDYYPFRLKMSDSEKKPVSGFTYYIKQNGSIIYSQLTTNNDGEAYVYLPSGTYQLYTLTTQEESTFTIAGKELAYEIKSPAETTLTVTKDNQPYTGYLTLYSEDFSTSQSIQCVQGTAQARIESGMKNIMISAASMAGYSKVTFREGTPMTLDFVSLTIRSEGKGLTFPYSIDPEMPAYFTKGSVVSLSAIPMRHWECRKWNLNGREIAEDRVELTIQEPTVATAIFGSTGTDLNQIHQAASEITISPNPVGDQLFLTEEIDGKAKIYSTDGKLYTDIYVLGNSLNVSGLRTGTYILVLDTEGRTQTATFIKK